MAGQVDRIGVHLIMPHSSRKAKNSLARGEGPQIHADKREDVVSGQDESR